MIVSVKADFCFFRNLQYLIAASWFHLVVEIHFQLIWPTRMRRFHFNLKALIFIPVILMSAFLVRHANRIGRQDRSIEFVVAAGGTIQLDASRFSVPDTVMRADTKSES